MSAVASRFRAVLASALKSIAMHWRPTARREPIAQCTAHRLFEYSPRQAQSGPSHGTATMQIRLLTLLCLLGATAATAHRNDRGMDYTPYKDARGVPCCNTTDGRPAQECTE